MPVRENNFKILVFSWVVAILILAATVFLYTKIFKSNQDIENKLIKVSDQKREYENLIAHESQIKELYAQLEEKNRIIGEDTLQYIEKQISSQGLKLIDLRKDENADANVDFYNLRLNGSLDKFIAFNYSLNETGALLAIKSYEIVKKDESELDIQVVLERYVF